MEIGSAVFLAVIQGLTEFLPISSSGHLLAARLLFGISDTNGVALDTWLHLGTLGAVLFYFRSVWWGIGRSLFSDDPASRDKRELAGKLALATVPAALVGYLFQDEVVRIFRTPTWLVVSLMMTAAVLWLADRRPSQNNQLARASWHDAWLIGLAQVFALLPGVSRSGVTMAAGRWRGMSRRQAASFSFLLSAPIIAGAGLASVGSLFETDFFSLQLLLIAWLASFISGLVAIYLLLRFVERVSLLPFALYLIGLATVIWYVG